ncbi:MAG: hypothetical protein ACRDRS_25920 [Pseudonocardiaceae bacterium]
MAGRDKGVGDERLEAERGVALGTALVLGDGTHHDGDTAVVRCAAGVVAVAVRGAQRTEERNVPRA